VCPAAEPEYPGASTGPAAVAPGSATATIQPSEITLPVLKKVVEAKYPPAALREGIEAKVTMEIIINERGLVEQATVVAVEPALPAGFGFAEAATAAVRQFEFEPARARGQPLAVSGQYTYAFELAPLQPVLVFEGKLQEKSTGHPVPGAKVMVTRGENNFESLTNRKGLFIFSDLGEPGEWIISVEAQGYYPIHTTEFIRESEKLKVIYNLEPMSENPYDVLVEEEWNLHRTSGDRVSSVRSMGVGGRPGFNRGGGGRMVGPGPGNVRPSQPSGGFPGGFPGGPPPGGFPGGGPPGGFPGGGPPGGFPGGEPPSGSIPSGSFPSVSTPSGSTPVINGGTGSETGGGNVSSFVSSLANTGGIVIHGSEPGNSRMQIEGIDIPLVDHYGDLRPVLSPALINYIDFYTTDYSVEYGRALAGVMEIKSKPVRPGSPSGYLDLNAADSSLYVETPITTKGAAALGGRYGYLDRLLDAVVSDDTIIKTSTVPRYYDAQFTANYSPAPSHLIETMLLYSYDQQEKIFKNPGDTSAASTSKQPSITFSRGMVSHSWAPREWVENEFKFSFGSDRQEQSTYTTSLKQDQLRDLLRFRLGKRLRILLGFDLLAQKFDAQLNSAQITPTQTTSAKIHKTSYPRAGFTEVGWRPFRSLIITPGIRVDYFGRIDRVTVDPRLTVHQAWGRWFMLKGGIGLYHQEPAFSQTDKTIGNPQLPAEASVHYSAGLEIRPRPSIAIDLTPFYQTFNHLVNSTTSAQGNFIGNGKGRNYGAEIFASYGPLHNFFFWTGYTYSRAELLDPTTLKYAISSYDQTHTVAIMSSYQFPQNWKAELRWRFVSGYPTTAILYGIFDSDNNQYDSVSSDTNASRLPAFHQLDFRVDKRFNFKSWGLDAYLDLQNVYNRDNYAGTYSYNVDYSEKKFLTALPFLPLLGVKAEFK